MLVIKLILEVDIKLYRPTLVNGPEIILIIRHYEHFHFKWSVYFGIWLALKILHFFPTAESSSLLVMIFLKIVLNTKITYTSIFIGVFLDTRRKYVPCKRRVDSFDNCFQYRVGSTLHRVVTWSILWLHQVHTNVYI